MQRPGQQTFASGCNQLVVQIRPEPS